MELKALNTVKNRAEGLAESVLRTPCETICFFEGVNMKRFERFTLWLHKTYAK